MGMLVVDMSVSSEYETRWELLRPSQVTEMVNRLVKLTKDFKKGNSINFTYMLSNIYFLSYVCSKVMNLCADQIFIFFQFMHFFTASSLNPIRTALNCNQVYVYFIFFLN
jgi:hypothetical protein